MVSAGWCNDKHKAQWSTTLTKDAAPLRAMRLDRIETADVLATLKPLWSERPETASRLQRRIARVRDAAKAKGLRVGENPARWLGHLDHLLPARQKLARGHHAALGAGVRLCNRSVACSPPAKPNGSPINRNPQTRSIGCGIELTGCKSVYGPTRESQGREVEIGSA